MRSDEFSAEYPEIDEAIFVSLFASHAIGSDGKVSISLLFEGLFGFWQDVSPPAKVYVTEDVLGFLGY
jgi:hypothetical protein